MDGENARARERVELALDGRQIASVVVGALVLLGVVFVLGVSVGRQLAARQLEAVRGDALAALDQPPPPPAREDALTFHDRLTRDRPALPEDRAAPPAAPAPATPAAAAPPAAQAAAPPAAQAAAPPAAEPAASPAAPPRPARGAFAVQVAATPSKAEAERLAAKLGSWSPRVEATEVPGKGRYYRVRVGSFATKPEAEKFLRGFTGKSGTKGLVVASR